MREGLDKPTAVEITGGLLREVAACRKEAFASFILRTDFPFEASEWVLEDRLDDRTLRSGVIDRVVFDGKDWFLVDYKTGQPPEGTFLKDFMDQQAVHYREQLLAYKEMLARAKSLDLDRIRLFLYFTALKKAKEIT
jgi:ATP-dependent exoDNAse (exonuclease V) beta subunit